MNNVGQNTIRQITTAYLALQSITSSHAKKNSNFLGKTGTLVASNGCKERIERKAKNTYSELRLLEFLLM